eukprot:4972488-Prymnesium_polylepis.2
MSAKPSSRARFVLPSELKPTGLLDEKTVKTGNYLQQSSKRQKAFLNDLATAFGSKWMNPAEIHKMGKMVSGSKRTAARGLLTSWCVPRGLMLAGRPSTSRQHTNCTPAAHRIFGAGKR